MDKRLILENLARLKDLLADVEMAPEDREVVDFLIREIEKEVEKEKE